MNPSLLPSPSPHERLARHGLLAGSLSSDSRARWPAWARSHFDTCQACQTLHHAEQALRGQRAVPTDSPHALPPRPTARVLRARAERHAAPPLTALFDRALPFSAELTERNGPSPMRLYRTDTGVRGWHPEARNLALFALPRDRHPTLIRDFESPRPGVSFDIPYQPEEDTDVVAVASRQQVETFHLLLWFNDVVREGALEEALSDSHSDLVHLARLQIPASVRVLDISTQETDLPEVRPEVSALLKEAAGLGRDSYYQAAARRYVEARNLAVALGDRTGRIKAALGLVMALTSLGYLEDAENVLVDLTRQETFDAEWGEWVCQLLFRLSIESSDLEAAGRYLRLLRSRFASELPLSRAMEYQYAVASGNRESVPTPHGPYSQSASDPLHCFLELSEIRHLNACGRSEQAGDRLRHLRDRVRGARFTATAELWFTFCQAEIAHALGEPVDWDRATRTVEATLATLHGEFFEARTAQVLVEMASLALRHGQPDHATRLFQLRFGASPTPMATEPAILGVAATPNGLLAGVPGQDPYLRHIAFRSEQFRGLVNRASEEVQRDTRWETVHLLNSLLFPDQRLPTGEVLVASDGLLASAPLLPIALRTGRNGKNPPVFRDLLANRRRLPQVHPGLCDRVVSLADAQNDLPSASREVAPGEADLRLRGSEVTRAALSDLGPVGLLHVAIHTRRERGMPELLVADGALTPPEIASIRLQGRPVVLLSSCASGELSLHRGVERNLAGAFLEAGAALVVATRWPVKDEPMYEFTRAFMCRWPFRAVPQVVTRICLELRERGLPPSVWAAPVVY